MPITPCYASLYHVGRRTYLKCSYCGLLLGCSALRISFRCINESLAAAPWVLAQPYEE